MSGDRIIFDGTIRGAHVVLMWRRHSWLDGRHVHAYQIGYPARPLPMRPDGRPRCFEVIQMGWLTLIHEVDRCRGVTPRRSPNHDARRAKSQVQDRVSQV